MDRFRYRIDDGTGCGCLQHEPGDISALSTAGQRSGDCSNRGAISVPGRLRAKRDQIRDSLLQGKEQELFQLFVTNLREQMEKSGKIKINQDEMKTLTRAGASRESEQRSSCMSFRRSARNFVASTSLPSTAASVISVCRLSFCGFTRAARQDSGRFCLWVR